MSNRVQSNDTTVLQFSSAAEVPRGDNEEQEAPVPDERELEIVFSGGVAA